MSKQNDCKQLLKTTTKEKKKKKKKHVLMLLKPTSAPHDRTHKIVSRGPKFCQ